MKTIAVAAIAVCCLIAMTMAQYPGYQGYGAQQSSGFGSGGILALIGGLILLMFLFNGNSSSSGTGSSTIIYGNFSGPTGGK